MKIKRLAPLALALPLTLLCACRNVNSLTFGAYWYGDTTNSNIFSGETETLEYDVSFEPAENSNLQLSYEGTYTMRLSDENRLVDGASVPCYHLSTELSVSATFTLNGESKSFEDSVVSDVYFLSVAEGLRPLESSKTVVSTSPLNTHPSSLDKDVAYHTFRYATHVVYATNLRSAAFTLDNLDSDADDDDEAVTVSLGDKGSYLDNEQLLFALRGLDMTSSENFRTINPTKRMEEKIAFSEAPEAVLQSARFTLNGEEVDTEIEARKLSLSYQSEASGQAQTFVYATHSGSAGNRYRHVLLSYRAPAVQSVGTVVYTLKSATFTTK